MKLSLFIALSLIPFLIFAQLDVPPNALSFRNIGPERGGRCTAVEGVNDQVNVYYAGYTGSGVWKTEDYGETWENISDGFFDSPSIGSIDVYQKNPNIIYVGTGTDGIRSNLIEGKGVYKSVNAGKTWTFVGLRDAGQIGSVEIHPENPDIVFVAAIGNAFTENEERGVYKTTDGGATWNKVLNISDKTGFSDLEFHPSNSKIIYAAAWMAQRKPWTIISGGDENGIYKSEDSGATWKKVDNGLPKLKGKIDLAVSAADPERLYALVEAAGKESGLYRTDNGGKDFVQVSSKDGLLNRPFYYTNLYADPTNAAHIYSLATRGYESHDGGKTWKSFNARHGDHHDIWMNPNHPNYIVQSNDGGANISLNGGKSWSTQFNQPTAEIYQVEVDNQFPYWVYGGQQDNYSTISVPSLPPYGMQAGHTAYIMNTGGCETGPAVPNPINSNIVYSNCKGRFSRYNKLTGQAQEYSVGGYYMYGHDPKDLPYRFQRVSPIHVSPHNPSVIYHCSQFVHKTEDEGRTWTIISPDLTAFTPETQGVSGEPFTRDITGEEFYSTIYAIKESTLEEGVIWVGANDGPIHVTKDGGKNWIDVTPENLPPGGRVDAVEPSAHIKGKAFVCVLRYQLGDQKPYIYKTLDYGQSWELITKGIPDDFPVRVLREDSEKPGLLFAGAEYGLFMSMDDGDHWYKFQKNLPVVPITDLKIHRNDVVISTMGRGFWILDDMAVLRTSSNEILHKPSDTYTYRYSSRTPSDRISTHITYPSPGVHFDYTLKEDLEDPIFMEILNADNQVVRRYRSEKGKKDTATVKENMNTSSVEYTETKSLKTKKGAYRFKWDMRHDSRVLASPGKYKIRLFSKSFDESQNFNLLADPRLTADGFSEADYKAQEKFSIEVAELIDRVELYIKETKKKVKELEAIKGRTSKQEKQLKILNSKLAKIENEKNIAYPQQMYLAQLKYLFGANNGSYKYINNDAMKRWKELQLEFEKIEGLE
ncbi:VPS10 domain-containing protein [Portibacter lacus]|uniref:Sortilin N-terminal domain-containing protein n=1 Tax=Portibacter lacus TaxID=1099794 RepID=A0AA37SQM3_9BACT|nr:hypothetical protein [Portibacter lacus]GLR17121.1 hypothetical protein GCM10007940_17360 [Portibacter lacus]